MTTLIALLFMRGRGFEGAEGRDIRPLPLHVEIKRLRLLDVRLGAIVTFFLRVIS